MALLAAGILSGCSKSETPEYIEPTANLEGKKFRAFAYADEMFGNDVYKVFEFKTKKDVNYRLEFKSGGVVNKDYNYNGTYTVKNGTQIEIKIKSRFDDENTELIDATVTDKFLVITRGSYSNTSGYELYK